MKNLVPLGLAFIALSALALLPVVPRARAASLASANASTVASGSVLLPRQVRLSFGAGGVLGELSVRPGERVTEGQVLARLQGAGDLEAALRMAEATSEGRLADARAAVRNAQTDVDNGSRTLAATKDSAAVGRSLRDLQARLDTAQKRYDDAFLEHRDGKVSDEDLSRRLGELMTAQENIDAAQQNAATALATAENNLAKAEDALRRAREQLERFQALGDPDLARARESLRNAVLVAPFGAVVEEVVGVAGEAARTGTPTITLIDTTTVQVVALVEEADVVNVAPGQRVKVTIAALPEAEVSGVVTHVGMIGRTQSGVVVFPVTISLPQGARGARSGMSVLVELGDG